MPTLISNSKFEKAFNFEAQPFHFHFGYQQMFAREIALQAQSITSDFAFTQLLERVSFNMVEVSSLCYLWLICTLLSVILNFGLE